MNNLIIFKDNQITFSLKTSSLSGNRTRILSLDTLYTPYGLIIPVNGLSGDHLDILEGKDPPSEFNIDGIVITHTGAVYRHIAYGPKHKTRNRMLYGKGSVVVVSDDLEYPRMFLFAMHLTDNNVGKSMKLMQKTCHLRVDDYMTFDIDDLVKEINKRGCTKPFDPVEEIVQLA